MAYKPEYAQGQILVVFKRDCSRAFAEDFGKFMEYKLSCEEYEHDNAYIFETRVGCEEEAVGCFELYPDFVDSAHLRDIKLEKRWDSLEQAKSKLQDLHDNIKVPDKAYNNELENIIRYLDNLKY